MTDQSDAWLRATRLLRKIQTSELPKGVGGPDAEFTVQGVIGLGDRVTFVASHPELGMIINGHTGANDKDEREAHRRANADADSLNALLLYAWSRGFAAGKEYCEERHSK